MKEIDVLIQAARITQLCDCAHMLFPTLCYYEGWYSPDQIDYSRAVNDQWSEDNPALTLWRFIENDLSRISDYLDAWLMTEGLDLQELLELREGEGVFEKGTLSRMCANNTKNLYRQGQFSDALSKIVKQQGG